MTALAYSREAASVATSLSEDEIDKAIKRGELRAKKKGRRVVILRADLEAWLGSLDDAEVKS